MSIQASAPLDRRRDDVLVAVEAFGLTALGLELQLSEAATVARVMTDDGDVAVKIFDVADVDEPLTRWQHEIAAHAAARGLPVPLPLRDREGSLTAVIQRGKWRSLAQASRWSAGAMLSEVDDSLLIEIGRTAAGLSRALEDAPAPPVHEPHLWDLRRSGSTLADALDSEGDPRTRIVGLRALRAFHAIERRLEELPSSVVHQDLHDENLRIDRIGGVRRVVGILDFGDATVGPRIADLVIPAAYAARHTADPVSAIDRVTDGWATLLSLTATEREVVRPLAAVRLATNAAVWGSRAGGSRGEYAAARSRGSLRAAGALLDALVL